MISILVFCTLFGATLLGLHLRTRLPNDHLCSETKDAVRLGMGSVATMAALILGLLVASTKTTYDASKSEVIQIAAKAIWLDRVLDNYGPEAKECRVRLRDALRSTTLRIWPDAAVGEANVIAEPGLAWARDLPLAIQKLTPRDDGQRAFKSQAAQAAAELAQVRWLLFTQAQSSISTPMLVMIVFWVALTYASIGLFAPPNGTTVAAQILAAVAVTGALYLVLELDDPFTGFLRISNKPILVALQQISK